MDDGEHVEWSEACRSDRELYAKYISAVYLRQCAQAVRLFGTADVKTTALYVGTGCSAVDGSFDGGSRAVCAVESGSCCASGDACRRVAASAVVGSLEQASRADSEFGDAGDRSDECCDGDVGQTSRVVAGSVCDVSASGSCDSEGQSTNASGQCGRVSVSCPESEVKKKNLVSDKYVPPAKRGPKGGLSVGRGPNYDKNQAARQRKKEARGFRGVGQAIRMPTFDACDQSVRDELQRTRANRLVVENKLRTAKMEQELEVVRSRDVQQMIQQQRTQLLRQTELNKVQIEKAHGSLSGEVAGSVPIVPTVVGGTVETILTSGSISPSSSISEAEIRKLHKDYLDGQAEIEKLKKDNYKLRFGVHQEDDEGRPDDSAPWDGGEDSVSQDQFSYRSGYMCTPEQREANKKLALELRGW